ncbi:hypothetical protein D3C80_2147690 [compost metagenome]
MSCTHGTELGVAGGVAFGKGFFFGCQLVELDLAGSLSRGQLFVFDALLVGQGVALTGHGVEGGNLGACLVVFVADQPKGIA